MNQPNVYLCALLVLAGVMFHFILKLQELESQGNIVAPWVYWRKNPYASLTVIMGAYLFLGLEYGLKELSYTSALLTGISCNSIGDKMRARANAALDKQP